MEVVGGVGLSMEECIGPVHVQAWMQVYCGIVGGLCLFGCNKEH